MKNFILLKNFFLKKDFLRLQKIICKILSLKFYSNVDKNFKEINKFFFSQNNKKLSLIYDNLNSSTKLKKFITNNKFFINKLKKNLKIKNLNFFKYQILLMKPRDNKENLGWHTDLLYYPKYKNKKFFVVYFNILNEKKNTLDVVKNTNVEKLKFAENLFSQRKKVKLNHRGKYYIKNNFTKKQITSCKLNTYDLLLFHKNLVHRSSKNTFNGFRMTYIIRVSN